MQIRELAASDYDQLVGLYAQLDEFHVQARPDFFEHRAREEVYPRDAFLHNLAYPGAQQWGAFDGEELVGFVDVTLWEESGMRKDLKVVCLDNIYVLPACRRRGIAAKLFAQAEAWAREQGAVRLELHTWDFDRGAIALYETMDMTPQKYVFEKKL